MRQNTKKSKRYSTTIKRQVIRRIQSGELGISSAMREYGIGGSMTIYRWLDNSEDILGLPTNTMEDKSETDKSKSELKAELDSLHQLLKYERLRSEAYLTMIKLAEERYEIPIEKKFGAKQSINSESSTKE